jgi:5-formyltetrahydrofolate cyclo-ligase
VAQEDQKEIGALLQRFAALVTYIPLRTEVDFRELVSVSGTPQYEIKPRASLDPRSEAAQAIAMTQGRPTAVLLPGRRFDTSGTRHGQGGGWYDRFLAQIPPEWLRIGICFDDQFSQDPLPRQSWDQVVDVVCVIDRANQSLSLQETKARPEFSGTLFA